MKVKRINGTVGYTKKDSAFPSRFRFRTPPGHGDSPAETKIVKGRTFCVTLPVLLPAICICPPGIWADTETLADQSDYPPFLFAPVRPIIPLILDNSVSMDEFANKKIRGYRCTTIEAFAGCQDGEPENRLFDSGRGYGCDNIGHYFHPAGFVVEGRRTPNIGDRSAGVDGISGVQGEGG